MTIYLTGDIHGDPFQDLSFHHNPNMRNLTENDYLFILGDFGIIWNWCGDTKEEEYKLNWLNSQKYTTIAIMGNHENWEKVLDMPMISKFNSQVRQCVYGGRTYEKIFIVANPCILDVDGQHIFAIPGADSHDIYHLLDPCDKSYNRQRRKLNKEGIFYRVIGRSWWPQEVVDTFATWRLVENRLDDHFDMILSHEAPADINHWYGAPYRMQSNDGQIFLHQLAVILNYDHWYHGHFHLDCNWPPQYSRYGSKITCLYHEVVRSDFYA